MPSNWAKKLDKVIKDTDKAIVDLKKSYGKLMEDLKELRELAKGKEKDEQ